MKLIDTHEMVSNAIPTRLLRNMSSYKLGGCFLLPLPKLCHVSCTQQCVDVGVTGWWFIILPVCAILVSPCQERVKRQHVINSKERHANLNDTMSVEICLQNVDRAVVPSCALGRFQNLKVTDTHVSFVYGRDIFQNVFFN